MDYIGTIRLTYETKQWLRDNPMDADNQEDLINWCLDEFNISSEDMIASICYYVRRHSDLPK